MEPILICPFCHVATRPTDYFCSNCGKNLRPKPPSTTVPKQILLYLGSLVLPPFGLIWAFPYLKQSDNKSRIIGSIIVVLTIISVVFTTKLTMNYISSIQAQMSGQMQGINGLGDFNGL